MRIVLGGSLLLLILGASFYAWVSMEPRSIPSLNPYIQRSLNKALPGYKFHVTSHLLAWDNEQNTLGLHIKEVSVTDTKNEPIATFPEIKINLTLSSLFLGRIKPTDVAILNPAFKFAVGATSSPKNDDAYKKIIEKLLSLSKLKPTDIQLQNINVRDADILVSTPEKDILVHIRNTYTTFLHEGEVLHIKNRIDAAVEGQPVFFEANISIPNQEAAQLEFAFSKIPSSLLKDIFPKNETVKNISLMVDGRVQVKLPRDTLPEIEHFDFSNITGSFSHPVYFTQPVNIKALSLKGKVAPDFSVLTIDSMDADFGGATLHASGHIKQKDKAIKEIMLDAEAANVPIGDIHYYWPSGLKAEPARNWVVQRIANGIVPKAYAKLRVSEQDIQQKHLSENSLEASVDFENGDVDYFAAYPPATGVKGTAKFTGKRMDIAITDGKILHSKVTEASVTIPDFLQHPAVITITGKATGKASDATAYFNADKVNQLLATDLRKLDGTATTSVNLSIPLMRGLTLKDMAIDIVSHATEASLPGLLGKYDIGQGNMRFNFNGSTIYLDGQAEANGVPISLNMATNLPTPEKQGFDGTYTIKGTLTPAYLKALKLPDMPYLKGETPFELAVHDTAGKRQYDLNANLDNMDITLEKLGWEKKAGQKMQLLVTANETADKQLQLSKLQVNSPVMQLSGTGQVSADFSTISKLDIQTLRFGNTHLALALTENQNARQWVIRGNSLDLSNARYGKLFSSPSNGNAKTMSASVSLRQVLMKNNETLTNVAGQIACRSGICYSGRFNANIGKENGTITMEIKPDASGKSGLKLESNRAENIARALNVYNNMKSGYLMLDATFSRVAAQGDAPAHNVVNGLLRINDFRAAKTPILAKIATLASFEGITSILENKGIKFKRLRAPFTFENETIILDDSKAYGESLGITTKGKIHTGTQTLDLNGTFVPSYTVNNILGKLPVIGAIGDVLMGGKGQGILAVRYKVKGAFDKPAISVNPLSILTPGFLRNLFDVVDLIKPQTPDSDLGRIEPAAGKEGK